MLQQNSLDTTTIYLDHHHFKDYNIVTEEIHYISTLNNIGAHDIYTEKEITVMFAFN